MKQLQIAICCWKCETSGENYKHSPQLIAPYIIFDCLIYGREKLFAKWFFCILILDKNLCNNIYKRAIKTQYAIQVAISTKVFAFMFFCFPYFIIQRNVLHTKYVIWLPTIRQFLNFLWRLLPIQNFKIF